MFKTKTFFMLILSEIACHLFFTISASLTLLLQDGSLMSSSEVLA